MVLSDPRISRASGTALRILESAHALGHTLDTAFFYHKGAYMAVNPSQPAERARWTELIHRSGLRCLICRTAAAREGLALDQADPWIAAGLADWISACERSDRVLTFGRYT